MEPLLRRVMGLYEDWTPALTAGFFLPALKPVPMPDKARRGPWTDDLWVTLLATGLIVAATIHFVLSPAHFAEARGLGLFFLALGIVQTALALAVLRHQTRWLLHGAMASSCVSLVVWAGSRMLRGPFADGAESIDAFGVATKMAEVLAVAASFALLRTRPTGSRAALRVASTSVAVGLLLGVAAFGLGFVAEKAVPALAEPDSSDHGHAEIPNGNATEPTRHAHEAAPTSTGGATW